MEWAQRVLADPVGLLADHAYLEKKAAQNAMELLNRWPHEWMPEWVEAMTSVARDEAAHLMQVTKLLVRRGGQLDRGHRNAYAKELRLLVRTGSGQDEVLDRLFVSALIELRSCERFGLLAVAAFDDEELAGLYRGLFASEFGHYKVFLKLARRIADVAVVEARWQEMLAGEALVMSRQERGCRIHSGV